MNKPIAAHQKENNANWFTGKANNYSLQDAKLIANTSDNVENIYQITMKLPKSSKS
jgi:hypothetical protein